MDPLTTMKEMYRRYKPRKVLKFVMADRKRQFAAVAVVAIMVVAIFAVLSRPGGDGTEDADFSLPGPRARSGAPSWCPTVNRSYR
jgi:hypothetical protein